MVKKAAKKDSDEAYKPKGKGRGRPRHEVNIPDNLTESEKKVRNDQMLLNCI